MRHPALEVPVGRISITFFSDFFRQHPGLGLALNQGCCWEGPPRFRKCGRIQGSTPCFPPDGLVGKKQIYAAGVVVFTASSVLCGLSQHIAMLIAFRVVQAIGAAMIMALGNAIITEAFPASERGKALGIGGLFVSAGIIAGPTLGGLILGTAFPNPDPAGVAATTPLVEVGVPNQTLHVVVGLIVIALALSLWALGQERRMHA